MGVNFVPSIFIIGRVDSDSIEVYPPFELVQTPVGNGLAKALTHLRFKQVTKSTCARHFFS